MKAEQVSIHALLRAEITRIIDTEGSAEMRDTKWGDIRQRRLNHCATQQARSMTQEKWPRDCSVSAQNNSDNRNSQRARDLQVIKKNNHRTITSTLNSLWGKHTLFYQGSVWTQSFLIGNICTSELAYVERVKEMLEALRAARFWRSIDFIGR